MPSSTDIDAAYRHECQPDERIARLAARQWGQVARWQLIQRGLSPSAIARRIHAGRLHPHPLWRGVYGVGHPRSDREARLAAAMLASGRGAVLAGGSASTVWGLRDRHLATIELIVPTQRRPVKGLSRRHVVLPDDERDVRHGLPVTTVARTLLDRAAVLDRPALERELEQAYAQRRADATGLIDLIERYPRAPGRCTLLAILAADTIADGATKSALERRLLAILAETGIALYERNQVVADFEVDGLWRAQRVVIELDSRRHHGTGAAFDRDRRKWRRLSAAGLTVFPVTWRHLDDPAELLVDLRAVL